MGRDGFKRGHCERYQRSRGRLHAKGNVLCVMVVSMFSRIQEGQASRSSSFIRDRPAHLQLYYMRDTGARGT